MNRRELILAVYGPTVFFAFAQGVIILSLPLLANERSSAYGFASLIVAAAAIGTLVADLPTGSLLVRLGLRRTMLAGIGLVGVSTLLLALPFGSGMLLALRLIAGVGTAMWGLARHTYVAEEIPNEWRGRMIAGFGGINRSGLFVGPLLAGSLVTWFGLPSAFILAGGFGLLAYIAVWIWIPSRVSTRHAELHEVPDGGALRGTWDALAGRRSDVIFASLAQVLAQLVRKGRNFLIPLYGVEAVGLDAFHIGLVMTISAIVDMLMFGPAGFAMDRLGRKFATVPSFSLMAIGIGIIPFTSSFAGLALAGIVIGLGNGMGSGTMMTLGADFAPSSLTSTFLSLWRFVGDVGNVLGPILVGVVAEAFTLRQSGWVLAGCSLVCALMMMFLVREIRVDRKPEPAQVVEHSPEGEMQKQEG